MQSIKIQQNNLTTLLPVSPSDHQRNYQDWCEGYEPSGQRDGMVMVTLQVYGVQWHSQRSQHFLPKIDE